MLGDELRCLMARTKGDTDGDRQLAWFAAIAGVILLGVVLLMVTGGGDEDGYNAVTSIADVHGMALDPEDSNTLYVATHDGLIRAVGDEDWARVGSSTDDFMGFSIHPDNGSVFWVSGHPSSGGNMGVRQSTDGGFTWTSLALEGVDFHAMDVSPADPDRLWGQFRGEIYRSDDGGHGWDIVANSPQRIVNFEPHPEEADTVYAAGDRGILRSEDAGATWRPWFNQAAFDLAIHPSDASLMVVSVGSELYRSTEGGQDWEPLGLDVGQQTVGYLALDPADPDTLYAATFQTGIYKTVDAGASWQTVRAPS